MSERVAACGGNLWQIGVHNGWSAQLVAVMGQRWQVCMSVFRLRMVVAAVSEW